MYRLLSIVHTTPTRTVHDAPFAAAALLHSIVENHAHLDGNERVGWLATAVFLEIDGFEISRAGNDDVDDLVIDVAAGQSTVDTNAERFRQLAT